MGARYVGTHNPLDRRNGLPARGLALGLPAANRPFFNVALAANGILKPCSDHS
jgi:hypothetical protein